MCIVVVVPLSRCSYTTAMSNFKPSGYFKPLARKQLSAMPNFKPSARKQLVARMRAGGPNAKPRSGNPGGARPAARNKPTRDWSTRDRSPVRRDQVLKLAPLVKYMPTEEAEFDARVVHISRKLRGPNVDYTRGMLSDGEEVVEFMCFSPRLDEMLAESFAKEPDCKGLRFSKCNIVPSKNRGTPTVLLNDDGCQVVDSPVNLPPRPSAEIVNLEDIIHTDDDDSSMEDEVVSIGPVKCVKVLQPHNTYNTNKTLYRYIMANEDDTDGATDIELHSWEEDLIELEEGSRWLLHYVQVCNFRGKIHLKNIPLSAYCKVDEE